MSGTILDTHVGDAGVGANLFRMGGFFGTYKNRLYQPVDAVVARARILSPNRQFQTEPVDAQVVEAGLHVLQVEPAIGVTPWKADDGRGPR